MDLVSIFEFQIGQCRIRNQYDSLGKMQEQKIRNGPLLQAPRLTIKIEGSVTLELTKAELFTFTGNERDITYPLIKIKIIRSFIT